MNAVRDPSARSTGSLSRMCASASGATDPGTVPVSTHEVPTAA
jgi:hypothetical protein